MCNSRLLALYKLTSLISDIKVALSVVLSAPELRLLKSQFDAAEEGLTIRRLAGGWRETGGDITA